MSNFIPFGHLSNDAKRELNREIARFIEMLADLVADRLEQRTDRPSKVVARRHDAAKPSIDSPVALTMERCAKATGLSRSHLYAQIRSGALKSVKVAGRRLILREDLEQFLREPRR